MAGRVREAWENVRTSWWFLPLLMAVTAILLSFVTTLLDRQFEDTFEAGFGLYGGGPDGSREVLTTIAGSMITVAGVAFSIAIVVMTLASSQFGPRVLRTFMRDMGNQLTLGTFVATFIFSLLALRTVRGEVAEADEFVPHLSVTVAILLTLASLAVFIYFIHHSARAIQASQIVAAIGKELDSAVAKIFPSDLGEDAPAGTERPSPEARSAEVHSKRRGYVQVIGARSLMSAAGKADVVVELAVTPGQYVMEGTLLARVYPAERVDDKLAKGIRGAIALANERSETQDPGFALDELQQVCLRALSSALNDPSTAGLCIDRMAAGISKLTQIDQPSSLRADDEGRLRVVAPTRTLADLLDTGFSEIRRSARTNVTASLRLLEAFAAIGARAHQPQDIAALRRSCELIVEEADESLTPADLALLGRRRDEALAAIRLEPALPPPIG